MASIKIRMISVEDLIETLEMLYNKGINFVDINGETGTDQDHLGFSFSKDYMDEEFKENFENMWDDIKDNTDKIDIKPIKNSDDINQLLS